MDRGQVTLAGTVASDAARLMATLLRKCKASANDQMNVEVAQAPKLAPAPPPVPAKPSSPHRARANKQEDNPENAHAVYDLPPVDPVPPPQPGPARGIPGRTCSSSSTTAPSTPTSSTEKRAGSPEHHHPHDRRRRFPGESRGRNISRAPNPDRCEGSKGQSLRSRSYVRLTGSAGKFTGKSELHLELVKPRIRGAILYPPCEWHLFAADSGKNTTEKVGMAPCSVQSSERYRRCGKARRSAEPWSSGRRSLSRLPSGKQVKIPSETKLDFKLDQPVTITVMPRQVPATQ